MLSYNILKIGAFMYYFGLRAQITLDLHVNIILTIDETHGITPVVAISNER